MKKDIVGLSSLEVENLVKEKKVNVSKAKGSKSIWQILVTNIFTLFNLINLFIAICLMSVKAWGQIFFIVIVLANMVIGIAQEIKAKLLVDKLTLLTKSDITVIRDGKEMSVKSDALVLGDVIVLEGGYQIPCDCVILEGNLELNESMLTGEVDTVFKKADDPIISGCFVVSGKAYCKITAVGDDSYSNKLQLESKKKKKMISLLLNSMKKVTFISTICIIPLGILLFLQAKFSPYFTDTFGWNQNVLVPIAGALLGMLPKGLVLLTSVSLATGVIKLARNKVLVQDLYSLETLSLVDVVCLDKTGTLTTGLLNVVDDFNLNNSESYIKEDVRFEDYFKSYLLNSEDRNETFLALKRKYLNEPENKEEKEETVIDVEPSTPTLNVKSKVNFSSERKFSAITFDNNVTVVVGNYDKLKKDNKFDYLLEHEKRLLIVGITQKEVNYDTKLEDLTDFIPLKLIVMEDEIRESALDTINTLKKERVDVKIISGDNLHTVSSIASKIGLEDIKAVDMSLFDTEKEGSTEIDYSKLVNEYNIFARVTPIQKKLIVQGLHQNDKKVCMTGDGINDLLALKEADCSITFKTATDAAKNISQIVMLKDDFAEVPQILFEGRRVFNNVSRSAKVFFIKTIYSCILTLVFFIGGWFSESHFPFFPIMITAVDLICEAFPSFFTMLDKDYRKVDKHFFKKVLKVAIPDALSISIMVTIVMFLLPSLGYSMGVSITISYLILISVTMVATILSMEVFTKWRTFVSVTMVLGFIAFIFLFKDMLHLTKLEMKEFGLALILLVFSILLELAFRLFSYFIFKLKVANTKNSLKK